MAHLSSIEPATGALLWQGQSGNAAEEVELAHSAWPSWFAQPFIHRADILRNFAELVRTNAEDFADLLARETGKPLWDARTEITAVINKVEISITAFLERSGVKDLGTAAGVNQIVRHKPHGVMAVLGPYNFPAHLPNGHIVPALLAGNAVIFKPSEKTPAVGERLVQLYQEAGVPSHCIRLLLGGAEEGQALTQHPHVGGILFTGSASTGIAINRAFADQPSKILALEMGGNNPILAWDIQSIDDAAALIVQSAFLTSGQRCTAASRLIVKDGCCDALIDKISALTGRLILDHPHADPAPYLGPVIDNHAAEALLAGFHMLVDNGATVIQPMARPYPDLPFLTPAIIDVTNVNNRPDTEFFGPLLQVIRVSDFDAALREANNSQYGLSASLIGGSQALFDQFWSTIRAGIINWNRPTNGASSAAPFGGLGFSGNHRPSAYYAADYCAYPVVSTESAFISGQIDLGLREN